MAAHYYFNSENDHPDLDPDGIDLPDNRGCAKRGSLVARSDAARCNGDGLWRGKAWTVWVTDAPSGKGHIFFKLHLWATKATEPG